MAFDLVAAAKAVGLLLAIVVGARMLLLIVRRLLEARLDIVDFESPEDPRVSKGLNYLVRAELARFEEEGGGAGLNFVFGPDQKIEFPVEVKAVAPQLEALVVVANYLPGRIQTLKSVILAEGDRGLGVVASLVGPGDRVASTTTIWEHDLIPGAASKSDTNGRYQRMALGVAAWAAYQLLAKARLRTRTALLTQDWESYALFVVGARLHLAGEVAAAREAYAKALDRDARNRGALFNIASLDLAEESNEAAFVRLQAVVDEIERLIEVSPRELDRLWYRSRYNRAVARWHHALVARNVAVAIADTKSELREIVETADDMIQKLGGDDAARLGDRNSDFVRFLSVVRAAAIVFHADVASRSAA